MSVTEATKQATQSNNFLRKVGSDSAEMASSGREFQISDGPATENARLPEVVDLTGGTVMWLVQSERSARRQDTSSTWTSGRGPRSLGARPCSTLYAIRPLSHWKLISKEKFRNFTFESEHFSHWK